MNINTQINRCLTVTFDTFKKFILLAKNLSYIKLFFSSLFFLAFCIAADASEQWEVLPPTPSPLGGGKMSRKDINGIKIFFSDHGSGAPIILLHGGPANSDYFANVANYLKESRRVISVDTRGHGRSTLGSMPLSYELFSDDVIGLMDYLGLKQADILGWSDGGITALAIAIRYPDRVKKIVAYGVNSKTSGLKTDAEEKPAFSSFLKRTRREYTKLSPTPKGFSKLERELAKMYATQPNWTDAQLEGIKARVLVMDGDHDEVIRRDHINYIARHIPHSKLAILEGTSHFSFLQDPKNFMNEVEKFLNE